MNLTNVTEGGEASFDVLATISTIGPNLVTTIVWV
jgi:hypothetical protein